MFAPSASAAFLVVGRLAGAGQVAGRTEAFETRDVEGGPPLACFKVNDYQYVLFPNDR